MRCKRLLLKPKGSSSFIENILDNASIFPYSWKYGKDGCAGRVGRPRTGQSPRCIPVARRGRAGGACCWRYRASARLGAYTLTFHFDRLRGAGLITVRRDGRSMIYAPCFDTMNALLSYLTENCCEGRADKCRRTEVKTIPPSIMRKKGKVT